MIKKTIAILVLAATCVSAYGQQSPKIVVVNFEELFQGFYEVEDALKKFQTSIDAANKELQDMAEQVKPDQEKFQELVAKSRNEALTEEARKEAQAEAVKLQQALRKTEQDFAQFQQSRSRELDQRRNEIRNQFIVQIREVVSQYAKDKGYELVLNSAPQSGAVVFVADSFDATDAVLALLNAEAPASK